MTHTEPSVLIEAMKVLEAQVDKIAVEYGLNSGEKILLVSTVAANSVRNYSANVTGLLSALEDKLPPVEALKLKIALKAVNL